MCGKLDLAKAFAKQAHGDQKYGDQPYTVHLAAVAQVLIQYGVTDEDMLISAWLHDTVEDTYLTKEEIRAEFGDRVAELVWCVTNEPGKNRRERHLLTYPKVRSNPDALLLKLADRIANIEACYESGSNLIGMYRKEAVGFEQALRVEGQYEEMWEHISELLK